jgi:hypothetical protein
MAQPLETLESIARDIGRSIGRAIPQNSDIGFALLLFDFGGGGHLTYISNAEREDMIKSLYECIANLQVGQDQPPLGQGPRQHKG